MTDRVHSLTVILDKPARDDDVGHLIAAIGTMRGVSQVVITPENISDMQAQIAMEQARNTLRSQLAAVLWPPK